MAASDAGTKKQCRNTFSQNNFIFGNKLGSHNIKDTLSGLNNFLKNSLPDVFLGKRILKIFNKFTGEHPWRNVISIQLLCTLLKLHFGMGVANSYKFAAYFQKKFF